jgi:hypothetical protein
MQYVFERAITLIWSNKNCSKNILCVGTVFSTCNMIDALNEWVKCECICTSGTGWGTNKLITVLDRMHPTRNVNWRILTCLSTVTTQRLWKHDDDRQWSTIPYMIYMIIQISDKTELKHPLLRGCVENK